MSVRNVQCLGGCPADGVVALDGPGRARVRFTALTAADADAVVEAALAHESSATGDPADWRIPDQLRARLSSVTVKQCTTPVRS